MRGRDARPFLTARWSNLVFLTFAAPEELVRRRLPVGIEPDRWEGKTHVSLVALEMSDIRICGCRVPGFASHAQVNFRLYARRGLDRGVWFLRQVVPYRLIACVARLWFREPFDAMRVASRAEDGPDESRVTFHVGPFRIAAAGSRQLRPPPLDAFQSHFTERYVGFRADRRGRLTAFRVEHEPWAVRELRSVEYDVDFGRLYGADWRFLNDVTPVSTIFAAGSVVAVYPPRAVGA